MEFFGVRTKTMTDYEIKERERIQDTVTPWAKDLRDALREFIDYRCAMGSHHIELTPARVVDSLWEMTDGINEKPEEILATTFPDGSCDQMVHRSSIRVVSTCAHHLLPFIGKAHFAYLPKGKIVGLSKIPRLIQLYSKRLQVQEELTAQIVDAFQEIVQPHGCGLCIRAYHFCEIARGVEEHAALTTTTALRGSFKLEPTRDEFLRSINLQEVIFP
jgi:GTP cyclohydrolase I